MWSYVFTLDFNHLLLLPGLTSQIHGITPPQENKHVYQRFSRHFIIIGPKVSSSVGGAIYRNDHQSRHSRKTLKRWAFTPTVFQRPLNICFLSHFLQRPLIAVVVRSSITKCSKCQDQHRQKWLETALRLVWTQPPCNWEIWTCKTVDWMCL